MDVVQRCLRGLLNMFHVKKINTVTMHDGFELIK